MILRTLCRHADGATIIKRALTLTAFRNRMKTLHERIESNYINKAAIDYAIINGKPFDGVFYFEKLLQLN